jgi:pimeloyl-ACP methyl ester carboxylesterase
MTTLSKVLLGGLALTACGQPGDGKTYVLVHGAFMGAAGWGDLPDRLRDEGAEVRTFDLPAHGDDATPATAAQLDAYVARVEAELDDIDDRAILVGHSMGGIVISQVAERRAADLDGLVYVAAYLPQTGQSLLDLSMMDPGSQLGPALEFHEATIGIKQDAFVDLFCLECDAASKALLAAAYNDEPIAPLMTKVTLGAAFAGVRKTYVHTAQDRIISHGLQNVMVTATQVQHETTLETGHTPMLAAPAALTEILLDE